MLPLVLLSSLALVRAAPLASNDNDQTVFGVSSPSVGSNEYEPIVNKINPLQHLAAISPYFSPVEEPTAVPDGCKVQSAAVLIRHSAIVANDDEWYDTMEPFVNKIANLSLSDLPPNDGVHPWGFLRDWTSPINEDNLEELSQRGKDDAFEFGKYIRSIYKELFPPKWYGRDGNHKGEPKPEKKHKHKHHKDKKGKKGKKHAAPYKIWTASSERDILTAKSYILGSFPKHQSGEDGTGDRVHVSLVEVPNKAKDWDRSLTPHKACDAFEKKSSLVPADKWLSVYAPKVRERLRPLLPKVDLVDQDILAMQMLCGYDTISRGSSPFCHLFTDEEWLSVEYYFDVRYHYMMGYGNSLSPYLGIPWVKTAAHLLAGEIEDEKKVNAVKKDKTEPLPSPKLPPNATHSQFLFPFFTHRESPAFVTTALNLYNNSAYPVLPPPLDHIDSVRAWKVSHISPFLGHISLEHLICRAPSSSSDNNSWSSWWNWLTGGGHHCHKGKKEEYVRAMVNGKAEKMAGCDGGVDGACEFGEWREWVDNRYDQYSDFDTVCAKKDDVLEQ